MKIAAFLIALVATFGAAVAVGGAIGPEPTEPEPPAHAEPGPHADPAHASPAATAPRGLAAAAGGLRIDVLTPELEPGRERALRFRILDDHGQPIRSFDVAHERRMHAIVVRRDLTGFQHVHPRIDGDGTWSVPLRLGDPGSYRLYADFTRDGTPHTLAGDLRVDGGADLRPLPAPQPRATSDGGDAVELDAGGLHAGEASTLQFTVTRDDRPVALAPYLGAGGHLVALREGDLAFLHVHPLGDADGSEVAFETTFPSAGRYRLFLQYRVEEQVRTAAFTLEVAP
ncbi:MAG TPA: hypothetical protein VK506_12635 [Conexibacter sp.]|nr:hypothetical protein [Conexibacter sp.]